MLSCYLLDISHWACWGGILFSSPIVPMVQKNSSMRQAWLGMLWRRTWAWRDGMGRARLGRSSGGDLPAFLAYGCGSVFLYRDLLLQKRVRHASHARFLVSSGFCWPFRVLLRMACVPSPPHSHYAACVLDICFGQAVEGGTILVSWDGGRNEHCGFAHSNIVELVGICRARTCSEACWFFGWRILSGRRKIDSAGAGGHALARNPLIASLLTVICL